jgi:hypothetical protein
MKRAVWQRNRLPMSIAPSMCLVSLLPLTLSNTSFRTLHEQQVLRDSDKLLLIRDQQSLMDALDVGGEISLSYGLISGRGLGNYMQQSNSSNEQVLFLTTPTHQHTNTPTHQHANTPTRQHANTPTRQHAPTPPCHMPHTRQHATRHTPTCHTPARHTPTRHTPHDTRHTPRAMC